MTSTAADASAGRRAERTETTEWAVGRRTDARFQGFVSAKGSK